MRRGALGTFDSLLLGAGLLCLTYFLVTAVKLGVIPNPYGAVLIGVVGALGSAAAISGLAGFISQFFPGG